MEYSRTNIVKTLACITMTILGMASYAAEAQNSDKAGNLGMVQKDDDPIVESLALGGSFLTSRIDANYDLSPASWCMSQIKGGIQGSSIMQCVNEDVFTGATAECPGGLWVVNASYGGTGFAVRTFPNASDQLFVQLTERSLCANAFGQVTDGHDSGVIVGGTGKFAGATGTYEWNYTGQILYGDPAAQPEQYFGSLNGTGTWTIELPD